MIKGTEGLSDSQIVDEVHRGGRFVVYLYCISVLVMSFRRSSEVVFVRAGQSRVVPGLGWTLMTFLLGWWGVPWGPIFSIQCIYRNLAGGKDVTDQFVSVPRAVTPA